MDLDRTSLGDRAQDLRTQKTAPQERVEQPDDAPRPVEPQHGGPLASSQTDQQSRLERDANDEARRREAQEKIARFLRIPGSTELDIQVDVQQEQVTFQIRDRDTGELLRQVPEGEAGGLFEQLREFHGALLDRKF
ncbi:MAG: flagellar protein FlaG [Planctomycetota bacterium]